MADANELVDITHPETGDTAQVFRTAFEGAWQELGWVLVTDKKKAGQKNGE